MSTRRPTVSAQWCAIAARDLMRTAEDNLPAWVLLGKTDRYDEQMRDAATLVKASKIKSIAERRAYLRANGIEA